MIKKKIYKCEICDNEFKNKNTLKKHFNNTHNNLEKEKLDWMAFQSANPWRFSFAEIKEQPEK